MWILILVAILQLLLLFGFRKYRIAAQTIIFVILLLLYLFYIPNLIAPPPEPIEGDGVRCGTGYAIVYMFIAGLGIVISFVVNILFGFFTRKK